jgi:hypothetical protein
MMIQNFRSSLCNLLQVAVCVLRIWSWVLDIGRFVVPMISLLIQMQNSDNIIPLCNEYQLDALFILSLFSKINEV